MQNELGNIYQKINSVMRAVEYVKKDKTVSGGGQSYKAVTHDQVIAVCRKHLVENGVILFPEQTLGEILIKRDPQTDVKMHLYSGNYIVHFVNMDKPEDRISVSVNAHAADNGDKAPGKCLTYAVKMAILKVLALETGEDEESRTAEPPTPQKQSITDERLASAIVKIKAGEYKRESLLKTFALTDLQMQRIDDEVPQ